MNPDELDRVLSREPEIVPSPGFSSSVMAAVRTEAAALPPIPFPWRVAMPGLAVFGIAIVWNLIDVLRAQTQAVSAASSNLMHWIDSISPLLIRAGAFGAGWVLLAFLLTFACLKVTWHIAGGRL
jgi:hypothetical protein